MERYHINRENLQQLITWISDKGPQVNLLMRTAPVIKKKGNEKKQKKQQSRKKKSENRRNWKNSLSSVCSTSSDKSKEKKPQNDNKYSRFKVIVKENLLTWHSTPTPSLQIMLKS